MRNLHPRFFVVLTALILPASLPSQAALIPELPTLDDYVYKIMTRTDDAVLQGTGIAVTSDRILTNCHVVADAKQIVAFDLRGKRYEVTGVSADAYHDACTLKISGYLPRHAKTARFTSKGDTVYSIGFPHGIPRWSKGQVTDAEAKLHGEDVIYSNTLCQSGISGGALLNADAEMVGLLFASQRLQNTCVAIPMYLLQKSIVGSVIPVGSGAPRAEAGSAYHDSW